MILAFYAQNKVQSTYRKFSEVFSSSRRSGREIAETILRQNGITDVAVEQGHGFLSDHYDPVHRKVRLSPHNYSEPSIAAISVAAHERARHPHAKDTHCLHSDGSSCSRTNEEGCLAFLLGALLRRAPGRG
jgi:Zn-dependent membrane protease YugP